MDKRIRITISAALMILALCLTAASALGTVGSSAAAPVAENLEISTYRGVSVGGSLSAQSAKGGELTFALATPPAKGVVEIEPDGSFVYTPEEGRRGRDYFGYRVTDEDGVESQEATVIIRIEKQKAGTRYADMAGSAAAFAAVRLAERGVFTGESLGEVSLFRPDDEVSRGEFLAMCMELMDTRLLSGVASTGFADDAVIPMWLKPYIATALMDGTVSGYAVRAGAVFSASESITAAEAAVMLNSLMGLTDVSSGGADAPDWACQAVANVAACGIFAEQGRRMAEQGRLMAEQEAELAQSRISIMLSQIQPHFLYNALNSIRYLCKTDPVAAQETIDDFSAYLRGNMDSLNRKAPVPLEKELEHVRIYLSLEKMRFEEDLNVVWDIRTTAFMLPALTVQPLVENAVKYGLGKKPGGGTVTISTRETEDSYEITVADDGVGYDPQEVQYDGRTQLGVDNVRCRLEAMSSASLRIESRPGEGTTAIISIPKEDTAA